MPDEKKPSESKSLIELAPVKFGAGQIAPAVLLAAGVVWLARVMVTGEGGYAAPIALIVIGAAWSAISLIDLSLLPPFVKELARLLSEAVGWAYDRLAGIVDNLTTFIGNLFQGKLSFDPLAAQNFDGGQAKGASVLGGGAAAFQTWLGGLGGNSVVPTEQEPYDPNDVDSDGDGKPDWWGGGDGTVNIDFADGGVEWIANESGGVETTPDEGILVDGAMGVIREVDAQANPAWADSDETETLPGWETRITLNGVNVYVDGLMMQPSMACAWINRNADENTRFLINIEDGDYEVVKQVLACLRTSGWVTTLDDQPGFE